MDVAGIPDFIRPQVHREDLQHLTQYLRVMRDWVASNSQGDPGSQLPEFPGPGWDIFPALVMGIYDAGDYYSSYPDNIRTIVARGTTLEGLKNSDQYSARYAPSAWGEQVVASNAANLPQVDLNNVATVAPANTVANTGGGPMPPIGSIVICIRLPNIGTASADGDGRSSVLTTSAPLYVFWWSQGAEVTVVINDDPSTADKSGLYQFCVQATGSATDYPTTGMTVGATTSIEFCNLAEDGYTNGGGATYTNAHSLPVGTIANGPIIGTSAATGLPLMVGSLPNPAAPFVVTLTVYMTGSSYSGNSTTPPSYTYAVFDLWGNTLAALGSALAPVTRPYPGNGAFNPATMGLAYYDAGGNLTLLIAYESPMTTPCSSSSGG